MWMKTAYHMTDVDIALLLLLGVNLDDNDHVERMQGRRHRSHSDTRKMLVWLTNNYPSVDLEITVLFRPR